METIEDFQSEILDMHGCSEERQIISSAFNPLHELVVVFFLFTFDGIV